jgi:acylphosphatase
VRVHLLVSGRVQGVGFREFTRRAAQRLGLGGWVRNLPGGEVEVVADGERDALERLVTAVGRGPAGAAVRHICQNWQHAPDAEQEFVIRW